MQRFEPFEDRVQVAFPDIASVDRADGHHRRVRQFSGRGLDFFTCIDRVDMQPVDRQSARERKVLLQLAEVSGEQHAHASGGQRIVGGDERSAPCFVQFGDERRLVDLQTVHTLRCEMIEQRGVARQDARQQRELVAVVLRLAEPQIRHQPDDDRLHIHAQRARLQNLFDQT